MTETGIGTQRSPGRVSDRSRAAFLDALVHDDPVALYESAPCGFLTTTPDGVIVKTNATFRAFVQRDAPQMVGTTTFDDLLTVGSRIYYGTHVSPSLLMSDRVQEVALDLVAADGTPLPVLVNASLARGEDGQPRAVRIAVFDASERRSYEQELLGAKKRAEASEREARDLARALQQTLLPPVPPSVPGLVLSTAYHPAGHGTEVGGDFYDVFSVGADEWVITLGDVCGKGYEAAIVTTLVRHTIRALCVGEDRPSAVLTGLDEVLPPSHGPLLHRGTTPSAPRTRRLVGHHESGRPPPARAHTLSWGAGALGHSRTSPRRDGPADVHRHHPEVAPGRRAPAHTDGVIEGRRGHDMYGEHQLLETAERHGRDPAALVSALVDDVLAFQEGTLRDDVALVAFSASP